jgi:hypothetical protein
MNDKKKEKIPFDIGGMIFINEKNEETQYQFVLPQYDEMPEEIYSNHIIVNHSPTEFNLFFTRINPPISKTHIPKENDIKLKVLSRINLPPKIIQGLIDALAKNLETFNMEKQ